MGQFNYLKSMGKTTQIYGCFIIILIGRNFLFSQDYSMDSLSLNIGSTTYEKIMRLEDSAYYEDDINLLRKYINLHTHKAKKEKNNIEIARSFYYLTFIEKDSTALAYADSIAQFTLDSDNDQYPTLGYTLKGKIYYDNGYFN
jgi:hypothetical protein